MAQRKQVHVGIVGLGFMGVTHYHSYAKVPGARVVAVADEDPARRSGDWRNIGGNFGPGGGREDLEAKGVRAYGSLEEMVKDDNVELVDVCLPTPFHRKAAVTALKAGKHVITEKPIALTLKDADKMLRTAANQGRHLFVGQVLRYFPEYRFLKQVHESGEYGKLLAAHFRRIIAKPNWAPDSWYNDPRKTGGAALDLHIHDADFIIHLLGKPKSVVSRGLPAGQGAFDYLVNQYHYGKKGPIVSSEGGWIATAALPFEQSYEVYFEGATILFNSSTQPVTVYLPDGKKKKARLSREDGFVAELKAVIQPLRKGEDPSELLAASARDSLALCFAEQESAKTGEPVRLR